MDRAGTAIKYDSLEHYHCLGLVSTGGSWLPDGDTQLTTYLPAQYILTQVTVVIRRSCSRRGLLAPDTP